MKKCSEQMDKNHNNNEYLSDDGSCSITFSNSGEKSDDDNNNDDSISTSSGSNGHCRKSRRLNIKKCKREEAKDKENIIQT